MSKNMFCFTYAKEKVCQKWLIEREHIVDLYPDNHCCYVDAHGQCTVLQIHTLSVAEN